MAESNNDGNKEPQWRNSEAQSRLRQLIESGEIPTDGSMKPKDIWKDICLPLPEFAGFLSKKFSTRLRTMRKQHIDKGSRAEDDSAALAHDRLHFPAPTHNHRGEPRWQGSEAERLLKLDVGEKKHLTMEPRELHATRPEYYENYMLEGFRQHIHQEVRFRKLIHQYSNR